MSSYRLICGQNERLNVDQIKNHPFFYGVDWETIRDIDAPFIPNLRAITDTSNFPTEDLESVPDQPAGADTSGANKDVAFLGYGTTSEASTIFLICDTGIPSSGSRSRRKHSDPLMVYASPYRPVYHLLYSSGLDHSGNSAQAFW